MIPTTQTRESLFSAVVAGVASAALFAASLWFAPLGLLLALFSPLPVAFAAFRGGGRAAAVASLAGAVAAFFAGGPLGASVYASQFAAGACLLGLAVRARTGPEWAVGGFAAVTVVAFWAVVTIVALRAGLGPLEFLGHALEGSLKEATTYLLQGEVDPQVKLAVEAWAEQAGHFLATTFPGLFGAVSILTGWLNGVALRRLTRDPGTKTWTTWKAPESWIWILIGTGLASFTLPGLLGHIARNLFLPAVAVYFLQGLAVVQSYFEAKRFPRVFRAAAYGLLFFQLPVMLLVAGLGAFDLWADFRARWSEPPAMPGPSN